MSTATGDDCAAPLLPERPSASSEVAGAPAGAEVTLSGERVDMAVHRLPRERARLRREVHTREVEARVTVRREVLRIERLPVDASEPARDADPADPTTASVLQPLQVVLREERPVVGVEVVPYERVRVGVDVVPSTSRVDTTAAHEVIDTTSAPAAPTAPASPASPTGLGDASTAITTTRTMRNS